MIKVRYEFKHRNVKNTQITAEYVYTYLEVSGHSSSGDDARVRLQVCAGVSAILNGIYRLCDETKYIIKYKKGFFSIKLNHQSFDYDTNYGLNCVVCQLYELYINYPKHFSEFEIIEKKGENYEKRKDERRNAKQRKQDRKERMDIHSCSKEQLDEENCDIPIDQSRRT